MAFSVDGVELGIIRPEAYGGLLRSDSNRDPWANGDVLAPFDKEVSDPKRNEMILDREDGFYWLLYLLQFYLSVGLAVGGVRTFPDDTVTGGAEGYDKPWSNTDAKVFPAFSTDKCMRITRAILTIDS